MSNLRNVGLNPARLDAIRKEAAETTDHNNDAPVDKTGWFLLPDGFEKWAPKQAGYYQFDVIQMHMKRDNYEMRKATGEKRWDTTKENFWWERTVQVHSVFPKILPCENNFGVDMAQDHEGRWLPVCKDAVCHYIRKNYPAVKKQQFTATYSILLLRLHPNEAMGIKDYKFVFYIDTVGKFTNTMYEEYKQMIANNVIDDNAFFFTYGQFGKSIKARFANLEKEIPDGKGGTTIVKWVGCNKIDVIDRKDQLTDADLEKISSIEVDDLIYHPSQEEFEVMMRKVTGDSTTARSEATEYSINDRPTMNSTAPIVSKAPLSVPSADDIFDDSPKAGSSKKEEDEIPW